MARSNDRSTMSRWILAVGLLGSCLLSYVSVSAGLHAAPHSYDPLMLGNGPAPEQYRVLVLHLAYWLSAHVHGLVLYRSLSLITTASLLFAGFVLLSVLEGTRTFREARAPLQWLGSASFVLLMIFYLQWVDWYYRPDTLPSAAMVAAMYWLWALPPGRGVSGSRRWLVAAGLLSLTALQGFIRADIVIAMNAGVFFSSLFGVSGLSLPRRWAMAVSGVGVLMAGAVLIYLARVAYPQANYGTVHRIMLFFNFTRSWKVVPFVLFSFPVGWTALQGWRRRSQVSPASLAVLAGALLFMAMWLTFGKADEVRIFTGFALALAPLTSECVMRGAEESMEAGR